LSNTLSIPNLVDLLENESNWLKRIGLLSGTGMKCLRVLVNGTKYTSAQYKRESRTANHVALVKDGCSVKIVCFQYFVCIENHVVFVAFELKRKDNWAVVDSWSCSQLMRVWEDR